MENWAVPGLPDLMLCDEYGDFHFIELKFSNSNAVDLRPHQVSWLTTHQHASVWVLVKEQRKITDDPKIHLYRGDQAMDLKLEGLKVEPVLTQTKKFNWEQIFNLITSK